MNLEVNACDLSDARQIVMQAVAGNDLTPEVGLLIGNALLRLETYGAVYIRVKGGFGVEGGRLKVRIKPA